MSLPPIRPEALKTLSVSLELTKLRDLLLGTGKVTEPLRDSFMNDISDLRRTIFSASARPEQYDVWLKTLRENIAILEKDRTDDGPENTRSDLQAIRESLRTIATEATGEPQITT